MSSVPTQPAAMREELQQYLDSKQVGSMFRKLVEAMLTERPDNVVAFSIMYLVKTYPEHATAALLTAAGGHGPASTSEASLPAATALAAASRPSSALAPAHLPLSSSKPGSATSSRHALEASDERSDSGGAPATAPEQLGRGSSRSRSLPSAASEESSSDDEDDTTDYIGEAPVMAAVASRTGARRKVIYSEVIDHHKLAAEHKVEVVPKSPLEYTRIITIMQSTKLFSHLEEEQHRAFANALTPKVFSDGDVIIRQGDPGDYFYIIDSGITDIFVRRKDGSETKVARVQEGGSFGELALLYNAPRAATVIAVGEVRTWAVDRISFKKIMMSAALETHARNVKFIDRVPIFEMLTAEERNVVADALMPQRFDAGAVIIKQGDPGDSFYIIEEGSVECTRCGEDGVENSVGTLGAGAYFGEIALLTQRPRQATVTAVGDVRVLSLDRRAFTRVMGPLTDILRRNMDSYASYVGHTL